MTPHCAGADQGTEVLLSIISGPLLLALQTLAQGGLVECQDRLK